VTTDAVVAGEVDLQYLRDALARAGKQLDAIELGVEPLTDGRTAASVSRLRARSADGNVSSFVLKRVPPASWRVSLGTDGSEARLWLSGVTRTLPSGLRCPTLDVARHASRDEWWLLMDDVSSGIVPRGGFDESKAHALMRSLARLHARYWGRDDELAAMSVAGFETTATTFARLVAHVGRGNVAADPLLGQLNEDFQVPRALVPPLLEALGPTDADFFLQLCSDHSRIATALDRYPRTLCHGDLRRANIAYVGDDVVLFDWELASRAPAARDLQWYWFLQFWAYPPRDGLGLAERERFLDTYVQALERERGVGIERRELDDSCEVAWLSVFCQIGCCLADPLTDTSASAETVTNVKRVIGDAIARARKIHDRHVR
jgi:hypothetical protein